MITSAFGFIIVLLSQQWLFLDAAAYNSVDQRELQSIWDRIPGLPNRTDIPTDPCEALAWIFETQVQQEGFECDCEDDDDMATMTCTRDEVKCDDLETGVQDVICHADTFTVSTSKDGFSLTNPKEFSIAACANYNPVDQVPDWLLERQICLVYSISIGVTGIDLVECGVTLENIVGRPQDVCTCSSCEGGSNPFEISIGFDCQVDIFGAVIFQECIPITIASLAAFPIISRFDAAKTPAPSNATSTPSVPVDEKPTLAPSTKNPGEKPSEAPASQNPGTDVPSTGSAGFAFFGPRGIAFGTLVATGWMVI
jgi:hypothetical protein